MKRTIRQAFVTYMSDTLLLGFAATMLLIFVYVLRAPNHIIGVGEGNLLIAVVETLVCVFAVSWATVRIVHKIKEDRHVSNQPES